MSLSTSPDSNASTEIAVGDLSFCIHGHELCKKCQIDLREDNDATLGIDHFETREGLEIKYAHDKNGNVVCGKHKMVDCKTCVVARSPLSTSRCWNFKKQLMVYNRMAKAGKTLNK